MSAPRILILQPESLFPTDSGGKRSRLGHLKELLSAVPPAQVSVRYVDTEESCSEGLAPVAQLGCEAGSFPREVPRVFDGPSGILQACVGMLSHYPRVPWARRSERARQFVRDALEEGVQVIAEGLGSLALLPVSDAKVHAVFVVHNLEGVDMGHRALRYPPWHPMRWLLEWESVKAHRYELEWMRKVERVVFISQTDLEVVAHSHPELRSRLVACPELIPSHQSRWSAEQVDGLLFVGDVGYFPNYDALEWLFNEFMPELWRVSPGQRLHVVGTSAQQVPWLRDPRVTLHGRVSTEELERLHLRCAMSISPIRFGSGVKMKVLDAVAYGMPIAATEEGLRGTRFSEAAVGIKRAEPARAARQIASVLASQKTLHSLSERVTEALAAARAERLGFAEATILSAVEQ